jgi:hypothetical protein
VWAKVQARVKLRLEKWSQVGNLGTEMIAAGMGDHGQGCGQWGATYVSAELHGCIVSRHLPPQAPSIAHHTTHCSPPLGAVYTMFSRSTACRGAQRAARQQALRQTQRRGLAAPASGSFQYEAGEAKGVKFASRDFAGPTTTLALVSKAGTRYQPLPGLTEGLANFAFRVRHEHHLII